MIVATPVTQDGRSAQAWGKAHWVGVADVREGAVAHWSIHEVAWDESHDAGTHGSHHARVVRFLKDQVVEAVVVDHMGEGMARMMRTMGIPVLPASPGDARESVLAAITGAKLPTVG
ncbi:NifB/NifX family molybdenum-iron cluster-binding protein [Tessaracoccus sp. G1721]